MASGSLGPIAANTLGGSSTAGSDLEPSKRARSINSKGKMQEHDNSLFLDGKRTVPHDNSFTEHLDEKNRMSYQQQEVHNISQTDIMKKRHGSTDRSGKQ